MSGNSNNPIFQRKETQERRKDAKKTNSRIKAFFQSCSVLLCAFESSFAPFALKKRVKYESCGVLSRHSSNPALTQRRRGAETQRNTITSGLTKFTQHVFDVIKKAFTFIRSSVPLRLCASASISVSPTTLCASPTIPFTSYKRRQILLLEVMIALAIIVLCIFPLIYPHAAIARAQRTFLHKIDLDHVVTLVFSDIYQDLQKNQIDWSAIQNKTHFDIDADTLKKHNGNRSLPYKGYYFFEKEIHKPKSANQETYAYLYTIRFEFESLLDKKTQQAYDYKAFILKELRLEGEQKQEVNPDEKPAQ